MRKFGTLSLLTLALLGACDKHDPILPGQRESIFPGSALTVVGKDVPNLPENAYTPADVKCPYSQDAANIIWSGDKKIFSGFPTSNSVKSNQTPVCDGNFVYAGLTTGELVKVNPRTRDIKWIADIYRASNMTGGAGMVDIITPIVVKGSDVYVASLGDAFCRVNKTSGVKKWCVNISAGVPFIVTDSASFILGTNNTLYAINNNDGSVYWATNRVREQRAPEYKDRVITIGREQFDATNGKRINLK